MTTITFTIIETIKGVPKISESQRSSWPDAKLPRELKLLDISEHKPSTRLACWAQKLQQQRLWHKNNVLVNDDEGDVYVANFPAVLFDLSATKFTMVMPRAGQGKHLHILKVYIRELSCVPL